MKTRLMKLDGHQLALASAISLGLVSLIFIPIGIVMLLLGDSELNDQARLFLVLPVLYFCLTYILGRPFIWIFNKCIILVKGIEIDLEEIDTIEKGAEEN